MELFEAVEQGVRQVVASEVQKLVNERLAGIITSVVNERLDHILEMRVTQLIDSRFIGINSTIRYEVGKEMEKTLREDVPGLADFVKKQVGKHCEVGGYIFSTVQEIQDQLITRQIEAQCEADGAISACIEQHISAAQDSLLESDELEEYVKDTCHDIIDDKLEDKLTSGYMLERAVSSIIKDEITFKVVIE